MKVHNIDKVWVDRPKNKAYVELANNHMLHIGRVDFIEALSQTDLCELILACIEQKDNPEPEVLH